MFTLCLKPTKRRSVIVDSVSSYSLSSFKSPARILVPNLCDSRNALTVEARNLRVKYGRLEEELQLSQCLAILPAKSLNKEVVVQQLNAVALKFARPLAVICDGAGGIGAAIAAGIRLSRSFAPGW